MRKLLVIPFILYSLFSIPAPARAADDPNLSVRIESPKSPTNDNTWKLSFTVLDAENRTPTVKCYVEGPSGGGFTQFDTDKVLAAGGGSGSCQVDSSVIGAQGEYEFYVAADAGSGAEDSAHVTVDYVTDGPGTPVNYSKEHPWDCRYIIKFKGANDEGRTKYVSVYRSMATSFPTDASTIVGSVTLTSNEEGQLIDDLSGDCDKTWYYVVRAFDDAGNGSGLAGDAVVITIAGETTEEVSAIPVTGGAILGEETATGEGEEATGTGDVLGDEEAETIATQLQEAVKKATEGKNKWWTIFAILVAVLVIYGFIKRYTSKKKQNS